MLLNDVVHIQLSILLGAQASQPDLHPAPHPHYEYCETRCPQPPRDRNGAKIFRCPHVSVSVMRRHGVGSPQNRIAHTNHFPFPPFPLLLFSFIPVGC